VSYSVQIQPFFGAQCTSWHNGGGIPLDLSSGVSFDALNSGNYIDAANPASSIIYTKIAAGGSMEQYASDTERALLLKWLEQGAQNN